jgi:hypothetical protein
MTHKMTPLRKKIEASFTGEYDPMRWKSKRAIIDAINETYMSPDKEYNKELRGMTKKGLLWELAVARNDRKQMKRFGIA